MKPTCKTRVYEPGSMRSHLCGRPAKHDNNTKCGIHCEAKKAARREKAEAKYAEHRAEADKRAALHDLRREAISIIRTIADGHNDPRSLCLEFIAKYDA